MSGRVQARVRGAHALCALAALWFGACSASERSAKETMPVNSAPIIDTASRAPEGVRIRVQVLNGSGRSGLARRTMQQLRDHGYDVVDYRNASDSASTTEVQVTPATRVWGERVVTALGQGTVRVLSDSLSYVDVIVLLGHDWQPTPQPLRP